MTSYIGYNNLLETGTVTVTSEAAGYEKENAFDWLPHDWWKAAGAGTVYLTVDCGANAVVDYWALAFHNLHDNSGTIKAQYSSDNFASDINDLDTVQTPSDGKVIMRVVTQRNVRYYRFQITSSGAASYIGLLSIGQVLQLPGHVPIPFKAPEYNRKKKILNNMSETGNFLGSSVLSAGIEATIEQKLIATSWIDANWDNLVDHIEVKPFVYLWDQENRPTKAAYLKATSIDPPGYNNPNRNDFVIHAMGLIQ